jgi:hypothetical protein
MALISLLVTIGVIALCLFISYWITKKAVQNGTKDINDNTRETVLQLKDLNSNIRNRPSQSETPANTIPTSPYSQTEKKINTTPTSPSDLLNLQSTNKNPSPSPV